MTSPISSSDNSSNIQRPSATPSNSAEQSAFQTGRNINQDASYFRSQLGGSVSSGQESLSMFDNADETNTSSSKSTDSDSSKTNEKKDDKKDDKTTDSKDSQNQTAQPNLPQQQSHAGPTAVERKSNMTPTVEINNVINQVIDKLQVSMPHLNGGQEVRLTLKTSSLFGTEVKIAKIGNQLNITFDTTSPEAMKFLTQNMAPLQEALNNKLPNLNVNINVGTQSTNQENNEGRSRGGNSGQQGQQGQQK